MLKVILDTNVLVSALIQKSYPFLIVSELVWEQKIKLCVSQELLSEYFEVLNRPKFFKYPDFGTKAQYVLYSIVTMSKVYLPKRKLHLIKDQKDNMILELAEVSKADFIVTGNTNDFTMANYKRTHIVTPTIFWELYLQAK